jgi:hypothetical protein
MEKIIHFYTKGLKTPLSKRETKDLRSLLLSLSPKRRQMTPLIVGYLLALRPNDAWLRKASRGLFGNKKSRGKTTFTSSPPPQSEGIGHTVSANHQNQTRDPVSLSESANLDGNVTRIGPLPDSERLIRGLRSVTKEAWARILKFAPIPKANSVMADAYASDRWEIYLSHNGTDLLVTFGLPEIYRDLVLDILFFLDVTAGEPVEI